jgi:hypothetical protein
MGLQQLNSAENAGFYGGCVFRKRFKIMLFPEEKKVYETTIDKVKFVVTSESLLDTCENIIDSLERLMLRDSGGVFDPNIGITQKFTPKG